MSNVLFFDIETAADQEVISILPEVIPNGTLKDPAKIAADIEKKTAERNADLGLDPTTCKIVCISARDEKNQVTYTWTKDEKTMLENFWSMAFNFTSFCTFNGKSFDVPVLMFRSMILGVTPCKIDTNPYSINNHYDLRAIFTGRNKFQKGSLDFLCKRLGCPIEPFGSGKDVQGWYDSGDKASIVKHCEMDIKMLEWLYMRMKGFYF